MKVQDVMSGAPRCCRPEDTLTAAARIMWDGDCGCVPVIDGEGKLVGMITDRDACMSAFTRGARFEEIQVADAMSRSTWSCRAEDPVEAAEAAMREHQVRRLPVVDRRNVVVGVLSLNDLIRHAATGTSRLAASEHLVEVLAAVGAPRTQPPPAARATPPAQKPAAKSTLTPQSPRPVEAPKQSEAEARDAKGKQPPRKK